MNVQRLWCSTAARLWAEARGELQTDDLEQMTERSEPRARGHAYSRIPQESWAPELAFKCMFTTPLRAVS